MAITIPPPVKRFRAFIRSATSLGDARWRPFVPRPFAWLLLVAACATLTLFAYQVTLVPQMRAYQPIWHGAQWIAPSDGLGSVAYYRKRIDLASSPSAAFLTAQGAQSFALYVNGVLLDRTRGDMSAGAANRAYIYDVTQYLKVGANAIAVCAINQDSGIAAVRLVAGIDFGEQSQLVASDQTWRATANASFVDQPCGLSLNRHPNWSALRYNDAIWPLAHADRAETEPNGTLSVDPAVYETAFTAHGIGSAGATNAYFFAQPMVPSAQDVWLRLATTGQADVYLNGHLALAQPAKLVADQTSSSSPRSGVMTIGLYDVTPDLRAGANQIAVHVDASTSGSMGQPAFAEIALDLLVRDLHGNIQRIATTSQSWLTSPVANAGWISGAGVQHWTSADSVTLSGAAPGAQVERLAAVDQRIDLALSVMVVSISIALFVLVCALLVALQLFAGWERTIAGALERVSIAFSPMLCAAALLLALAREPLMPHPFPYTGVWLAVLIALACGCCAVVLLSAWRTRRHAERAMGVADTVLATGGFGASAWSARYWRPALIVTVVTLTLLGAYLALYNLGYENYWQDELATLYAAQGVLHRGVPSFPSGYIYPKAELFDYIVAGVMAIFGSGTYALRALSAIEYIVSLPLMFFIGRFFLGRRAALIALTLTVFSPVVLRWGRELRMYEQAELCALLLLYFFFRAIQPAARPQYIYLAMTTVVVMYLSHEETFILFPAILLYFFATQRLEWIRNRHWWFAGAPVIVIIGLQLLIARAVLPPSLGTDSTNAPLISLSVRNVDYYLKLLFAPNVLGLGTQGFGVTAALASIAALISLLGGDRTLRYLAVFAVVPLLCLSTMLTLRADRYIIPILPALTFLAAAALVHISAAVERVARLRMSDSFAKSLATTCLSLLLAVTVVAQVIPIANFSLGTSRALGLPYHHQYPDYQTSGDYLRAHWHSGDVLITLVPVTESLYYGVQPGYILYQNKALYVFERNGHITDNYAGAGVLLNEADLRTVLASSQRVWLFASASYQCCGHADQFALDEHFRLVFQSLDTAVYLRSG